MSPSKLSDDTFIGPWHLLAPIENAPPCERVVVDCDDECCSVCAPAIATEQAKTAHERIATLMSAPSVFCKLSSVHGHRDRFWSCPAWLRLCSHVWKQGRGRS